VEGEEQEQEESEVGESTSSSTGMGNRYPIFLDGEAMRGASGEHTYWRMGHGRHGREWGIHIRPSRRPEDSIIESVILVSD
jgi:hypothetical protein